MQEQYMVTAPKNIATQLFKALAAALLLSVSMFAQTVCVNCGGGFSNGSNADSNTAELFNGLNSQTLNIYGNRTDASNYARLRITYDDVTQHRPSFIAEKAGSGTQPLGIDFSIPSGTNYRFSVGGANAFFIGSTGVSFYNSIATAAQGVPPIRGTQSLTAQNAAISATSVYASAPAGLYRLCFNAATTTSGTGTTATVSVIWNDGNAKTFTSATFALNAVDVTGQANGCQIVRAAASTNIQVSTAGTFGTSVYRLDATVEALQ
jgi:hypothetical protein